MHKNTLIHTEAMVKKFGDVLFFVFEKKNFEVGPIFGQNFSKKIIHMDITFHSLNQNASVRTFWKGLAV